MESIAQRGATIRALLDQAQLNAHYYNRRELKEAEEHLRTAEKMFAAERFARAHFEQTLALKHFNAAVEE